MRSRAGHIVILMGLSFHLQHVLVASEQSVSSQDVTSIVQSCPEALTPDSMLNWWTTKVWSAACCASALSPLRRAILDLEANTDGNVKSNVGGWQSKAGIFESSVTGIKTVRDAAYQLVAQYVAHIVPNGAGGTVSADIDTSWVNVNRFGDMNRPHTHSGFVSGVYYVDTGQPAGSTNESLLCFYDPRPQVRNAGLQWSEDISNGWLETETICKVPRPGLMILFPAWLDHYVTPLKRPGPRISISFNVGLKFPAYSAEASKGESLSLQIPEKHGGRKIVMHGGK